MMIERTCCVLLCCLIIGIILSSKHGVCEEFCPEREFVAVADTLDKTQIASVLLLAENFSVLANELSETCNERLFLVFRQFYYDALEQVDDAKSISDISYPISPEHLAALNTELSRVGWTVYDAEGIYFIGVTGDWLRVHFGQALPESWDRYFRQNELEIAEGTAEDHGLLVPWDTLRHRIVFWEQFLHINPDFPLQKEITGWIHGLLYVLLTGLDNSRIDHWPDSRALQKEVRETYEAFLLYNSSSQYHDLVKGYYDILKKYDFSTSKESRTYLEMKGMSPPLYWRSDKDE